MEQKQVVHTSRNKDWWRRAHGRGRALKSKPATDEKELALIEKSIINTMRKFRESPKTFWSADDIRCHLKLRLLKSRLFKTGRIGNVFLSFPTRSKYERGDDGSLVSSTTGKTDYYALAGWTASIPTTWNHLTQQLSFAIEVEYFPTISENWATRIKNDLMKLSDETNNVPVKGRFFLLLTVQPTSMFRGQLNALFEQFPSVRCYQQIAQ
jgi:hypothetical protein